MHAFLAPYGFKQSQEIQAGGARGGNKEKETGASTDIRTGLAGSTDVSGGMIPMSVAAASIGK